MALVTSKRRSAHEESFDEFFAAMLPRAIRTARRVTDDPATAEDVAVEALAKAHVRWARVGALEWRDAWLLEVASREALRHVRPAILSAQEALPDRADRADRADGADGADAADAVVLRRALLAALSHLPRREREAIVLRYLCDLSEKDVAAALHVSPGTVKTHIHRGLAALRANNAPDLERDPVDDIDS